MKKYTGRIAKKNSVTHLQSAELAYELEPDPSEIVPVELERTPHDVPHPVQRNSP